MIVTRSKMVLRFLFKFHFFYANLYISHISFMEIVSCVYFEFLVTEHEFCKDWILGMYERSVMWKNIFAILSR